MEKLEKLLQQSGKYRITAFSRAGEEIAKTSFLLHHGLNGYYLKALQYNCWVEMYQIITPSGEMVRYYNGELISAFHIVGMNFYLKDPFRRIRNRVREVEISGY